MLLPHKTISQLRKKYRLAIVSLMLVVISCIAFSFTGKNDFESARQEIIMRKIGHEVLLHSGDRSSRVLPVKKISDTEYQIRFEKEFTFQTDSLITIVKNLLSYDNIADNYIVKVLGCSGDDVLFGYAFLKNGPLMPCTGRIQPKGCYLINISFEPKGITALQKGYIVGGLSLFAFVGCMIALPLSTKKRLVKTEVAKEEAILIGNTLFDPVKRLLTVSGKAVELTPKENKLFRILSTSPNTIIERSRIQKEIWEDEGVIVGRSLDVFISKLRKKLENDPTIQLVNIHGKGYKLETAVQA